MKNLTLGKRIVVAAPALVLMVLGTVVWDMKVLALAALGYLFIADFILKKQNKKEG
jgi:hypothetical protein